MGLTATPGLPQMGLAKALSHPHLDWPPLLRQLALKTSEYPNGWETLPGNPQRRVWTDNYTNLFGAMTWDR